MEEDGGSVSGAAVLSLSKKSLWDFFDKLIPPGILVGHKMPLPEKSDKISLFGRRFYCNARRALPPVSRS